MTDKQNLTLLRRSPLLPDETLGSLLARLTQLNHYEPARIMRKLCLDGTRDKLHRPLKPETYCRLAQLTGLAPRTLYDATIHRLAPVILPRRVELSYFELPGGDTVPFLPTMHVTNYVTDRKVVRYCPHCLAENAYERMAWRPRTALLCLKHQTVLRHGCPGCHQTPTAADLAAGACRACETDLTTLPTVHVDEPGLIFTQQLLSACLGFAPPPDPRDFPAPFASFADSPAAALSPRALYDVVEGLCDSLSRSYGKNDRCPPDVPTSTWKYRMAVTALCDWPTEFHALVDSCRVKHRQYTEGLTKRFNELYRVWLENRWRYPEFDFLQEAFSIYITQHLQPTSAVLRSWRFKDRPDLRAKFKYMKMGEAAQTLGVSSKTVEKLVAEGHLRGFGFDRVRTRYRHFLRADVLALRDSWGDGLTLTQAATWVGVSEEILVAMVKRGLIEAERGPTVDDSAQWLFLPGALEAGLKRILQHVRYWDRERPDALDLTAAAQKLFVIGLDAVGILESVTKRKLQAYRPLKTNNLAALRFRAGDIQACIASKRMQHGWVTRQYLHKKFGVKFSVISKWVAHGLLKPVATFGGAEYFDKEEVDRFDTEHAFTARAASILEVSELTVQKWTRKGRLTPVAGPHITDTHRYLFRVDDLKPLRLENRCSAPAMALEVGVSHAQMVRYIKQGKVEPISGPGIDDCGTYMFLKSDVEEIRQAIA